MPETDTFNRLTNRKNLYHISQSHNTRYDTYKSAIVAAWTEGQASRMHPGGGSYTIDDWVPPHLVKVVLVGLAETGISGIVIVSRE